MLCASPALAQTEHVVRGGSPAPVYTVCDGDTLLLRSPMGRELLSDGSRARDFPNWLDRAALPGPAAFVMDGSKKMVLLGYDPAKGYVYAPVDAPACAVPEPEPKVLFGANLSGAEGAGGDAVRPTLADFKGYIEYYGFDIIRYPFKDARMTASRIAELKANIEYAISMNVPVILDNHTYKWLTPDEFVAFWVPFMANFPKSDMVMIDLVNEPKGFNDTVVTNDWMQWIRDVNLTIPKLRAAGITNPILIEWPGYSATFRFDKKEGPNTACASAGCAIDRAGGIVDPLNKTYMNGHRYFDEGSRGYSKTCTDQVSGFATFAANLRKRGLKGYVTESAFGSSYGVNASCVPTGAEAITSLKANPDVIKAITWWGGGRIWPEDYAFKIDSKKETRYEVPLNPYLVQIKAD